MPGVPHYAPPDFFGSFHQPAASFNAQLGTIWNTLAGTGWIFHPFSSQPAEAGLVQTL